MMLEPLDFVERLITDDPCFHANPDGSLTSWAMMPDALRFMARLLHPGMRTLETGAGQSTVVFLSRGCRHTCVTFEIDHIARIREYCRSLELLVGSSDVVLPTWSGRAEQLDFVLIDGAHRFPFACIDWHYTHGHLRVGGILAVDDYRMPSVAPLVEFLKAEEEWRPLSQFGRTAFFEKIAEAREEMDCQGQRINQVPYDYD